ncbi:MAG TPA: serine protease, partial [Thiotrichales bacterium]|nr:serine protease [Thiotrichales bacterium]
MKYLRTFYALFLLSLISLPAQALDGGVENLRQTGKAFASVARAVSPSVVNIQVERKASTPAIGQLQIPFGEGSPFGDDFFKRFFGDDFPGIPKPQNKMPEIPQQSIGQGSGFVFKSKNGLLSDKTYIMTNNHVVE